MNDLREQLELALFDALDGSPWSPALAARFRTVTRAVLLRHRLPDASIHISNTPDGVAVRVTLPPSEQRVQRINLLIDTLF